MLASLYAAVYRNNRKRINLLVSSACNLFMAISVYCVGYDSHRGHLKLKSRDRRAVFRVGINWLLASLMLITTVAARGQSDDQHNVQAALISSMDQIEAGQSFYVLLKQDIRPGWHTYWRNPGDSGAATALNWELPEGFSASEMQWPYPERVAYGPLMNFGYHGQVLFPIKIQAPDIIGSDQVTLKANGKWLVCADICIPEGGPLSLTLDIGKSHENPDNAALFESALQKIPQMIGVDSTFEVIDEALVLFVEMSGLVRQRIQSVDYFPYTEGVVDNPAEQQFRLVDNGFELKTKTGYDYTPDSQFGGIVVIRENSGELLATSFEIEPKGLGAASGSSAGVGGLSFLTAVLFAFVGGLILNLMPCVFPVLSIKVLSLMQETEHIRGHGWVYMAGVVLSFVAVAGVLIVLRASGAEIGWGFQLQSPLVVSVLAYLFLLIGLNLSGYFEFGTGIMNLGQGMVTEGGYGSSFFTGVLATVVAAPCTAPFMASAIGYALTQSNINALAIFASLGFGMAVPYVMLCHSPALLKRLPKPGPWMETAKELLSFPMFGSAIWLLWVLSVQSGPGGVLFASVGALCLVFGIWLLKNLSTNRVPRLLTQLVVVTLLGSAIYLPNRLVKAEGTRALSADKGMGASYVGPLYETYSAVRLGELRQQGPVFVNFTAAWCITCKVNEAVALDREAIRQAFESRGIGYLKGDWTNEDPEISRKLTEYGRSGVPLYLLYAGSSGDAVVLPQILTEGVLLNALNAL
ncbi:MAG TPA: hypothetical protein EYQ14_01345 [Gammaproteobacteria bacterium]|nr:hypothetical protein [Gammaproteobacteria bacterium]